MPGSHHPLKPARDLPRGAEARPARSWPANRRCSPRRGSASTRRTAGDRCGAASCGRVEPSPLGRSPRSRGSPLRSTTRSTSMPVVAPRRSSSGDARRPPERSGRRIARLRRRQRRPRAAERCESPLTDTAEWLAVELRRGRSRHSGCGVDRLRCGDRWRFELADRHGQHRGLAIAPVDGRARRRSPSIVNDSVDAAASGKLHRAAAVGIRRRHIDSGAPHRQGRP